MTGEILREVAVLIGVFVLLDVGIAAWEGELSLSLPQTIFLVVGDLLGSSTLAFFGMILERWR
jgi:hypothetical protein